MIPDLAMMLADEGWSPAGVHPTPVGEVAIATRDYGGTHCARADMVAAAPVSALVATVTDLDRSERWSGVARSEVISRSGQAAEWLQVLEVPSWTLASSRYWLSRGGLSWTGETAIFHWSRVPDGELEAIRASLRAELPNAIELSVNTGFWRFTPGESGTTIRYVSCSQDSGSLPPAVSSFALRQTLPQMLARLVGASG